MVSASSFGLVPLFSLPELQAGMDTPSVMLYRFGFGALFVLAGLAAMRVDLSVTLAQLWRITALAALNAVAALTMVWGYRFMPSGPACTIQFSYPVFTVIIMMVFYHERLTLRTALAIVLAVLGVAALSGIASCSFTSSMAVGVALELLAGLSYAVFLVMVPKLNLNGMPSLKVTFWVFVMSVAVLLVFTTLATGGIHAVSGGRMLVTLLLLGFVPTALSNFTLIVGLKDIGSTLTSVLGALEPLTAMVVGVLVFHEDFGLASAVGLLLIVAAVTLLIFNRQKAKS